MRRRPLAPLPGALLGLTVAAELAAVLLSWGLEPAWDTLLYAVFAVTLAGAGALVASRHRENAVGWLLLGSGLFNAVVSDLAQGWGLRAAQLGWPGGPVAEAVAITSWLPSGVGLAFLFLRFPDGRLPGPRWRVVEVALVLGCLFAAPGWASSPDRAPDFAGGSNPLAGPTRPLHTLLQALLTVGLTVFVVAFVASVASLLVRLGRARGDQRQQLKGFVFTAALMGVLGPVCVVLWETTPLVRVLAAVMLTMLPVVATTMILRYHLYDVDLVVSRTVGYAVLTVLLAATYVAAALVIGARLGRGSAWTTAGATLVAAVAFNPLRERVQDGVDRRFRRAQYDARQRMVGFYDALLRGDLPPEAVEGVLRDVLDDTHLTVLYSLPGSQDHVDARGTVVETAPGDIPVEWNGHAVGVVRCGPLGHEASHLARELVRGAGLAIEMSRLRVELREKLTEVEASRARIVAAAQEERRRIERDLHDGAQQRLVSIGLGLRHVQHRLAARPGDPVTTVLDDAVAEVTVAIEELRSLAHGIVPPQLDAGLAPAFRELARRSPVPVVVHACDERFPDGVEAAAYFFGCEGVTNAVKHARASRIELTAARRDGRLVVSVRDDGTGRARLGAGSGLRGLADRVAALGGTMVLDSARGRGTVLTAELPCGS